MKYPGVFDKTPQKTVHWCGRVSHHMGSSDVMRGYRVLRSVLHALRDRLPHDEAGQLGAQMPMLVRGFYYEGCSGHGISSGRCGVGERSPRWKRNSREDLR